MGRVTLDQSYYVGHHCISVVSEIPCSVRRGGGVISGKVGTGARMGCLFSLPGLSMTPFIFENWFENIGCILAKCLIFDEFFL